MHIQQIIQHYRVPLAFLLSIVAVVSGVLLFYKHQPQDEQLRFLTQEEIQEVKGLHDVDLNSTKILVDIEGQVTNPGVIEIESGATLLELIERAGGFTPEADMCYVQKNLNLAEEVKDRQKIYIPSKDENLSQDTNAGSSGSLQTGLVNLNTASLDELDSLPGVGPSTAGKIIDARPFSAIEDLMDVGGIGESTFEKLKDKIEV